VDCFWIHCLRLDHSRAFVALCGLALSACAGNGVGLDSNGQPLGSTGPAAPLEANFQSIQDNVFTPICSVCHAGGAAPQGLRLDAANSYALLVGVPSTESPGTLRIKPGDPDNSYMVQKIEGVAAVGAQMPLGEPPLSAATIAVIRQWVTDGALNNTMSANAASSTASRLALTKTMPATGDALTEAPARIFLVFNHELDASDLDASLVRLERLPSAASGPERLVGTEVIAVDAAVPVGNPTTLMITPRLPLEHGAYRLVVPSASNLSLSDLAGQHLGAADRDTLATEFTVNVGASAGASAEP